MDRVFVVIYFSSQNVIVDLGIQKVPEDYDTKQCYLCHDIMRGTMSCNVICDMTHKKDKEELYCCDTSLYTNHHNLCEWQPHLID